MTARQTRKERRAAERKAKKLARKATQRLAPEASQVPHSHHAPGVEPIPELPPPPVSPSLRAETNRANAQHSTGPRTPTGKLASSRNSLKHGLASSQLIIPGENRADFDTLLAGLLTEHQPAGPTEELLVHEIAQSWWLTQRALRFQNECFTAEGVDQKRLALFLRYQTTHERAFHKALSTLIRLKKDRARGFVSQAVANCTPDIGFVSQNQPNASRLDQFVSQNGPLERRFHGILTEARGSA